MFEKLLEINKFDNIGITGLTNELISFCVSNINKKTKRDILVVTSFIYEANIIYSSLSKLNNNCYLFPMDDFLTSEALASSPDLLSIRLNTLNEISNSKNNIVITNLMGLIRYLPSKELWKNSIITIKKGDLIDKDKLVEKLINLGYTNETTVTNTGEYASRGFVLDIYPVRDDFPVRIEFWGDEIDSIRYFDPENQRSNKEINKIIIDSYSEFINEKGIEIESKQKYLPLVTDKVVSIFDYLDNPITIIKDYNQINNSYTNLRNEIFEYDKALDEPCETNYMFNLDDINFKDTIYLLTIDNLLEKQKLDKIYNLNAKNIDNFKSNIDLINEYIKNSLFHKKTVIISVNNDKKIDNIKKFLEIEPKVTTIDKLYNNDLNIVKEDYDEGFELDNYILITENELFGQKLKNVNYKNKLKIGSKIKDINNLSIGDYVVHINHGIGVYNGLKTLVKNGNQKDYLEISYQGQDKLFIPVEKIDLISKYSSKEGYAPKLNKLGGTEWQKTKLRIKNKVKDIADKLIKISAERSMKEGFAFKKDDDLQKDFDDEFAYTMTKDQYIATDKIKKAMESKVPMDMLLCGDVGYGKTEVAFRAIFKAINSGKQVAYLCPTTILSNQQYTNSIDRFKSFGIEIALLNRYTSTKRVSEIYQKLESGKIDLVIGTHKLLNEKVKFKDLGLLIIDEEQRFGVTHKEKIKEYKANVDVLTLSATPIPRTLQMSLVGIRDLALIETPPASRYPVQTYVVEESNALIKDAIYKEMSRNGQVFILYNRVEFIEEKRMELKRLIPEADIRIAHGQMTREELEDTMNLFINNEFNILLCTTIIETGIDIPNVNTLIVFDADRFGLSQLYQIRGRVGRSNKIAYAYLMHSKSKSLSESAVKRLNAIKEFTELGSGFSIAMRDLSIRGAGDILGSEQAGFIDSVGYDLYVKILNDEVARLKGLEIKEEVIENEKPLIEVATHIDNSYVDNDSLKIEIHKLINEIDSKEKIKSVKQELEDRFGKLSDDVIVYMYSEWFEKQAKSLNINDVVQNNLYVEFSLEKNTVEKLDVSELFYYASNLSEKFRFNYKSDRLYIKLLLSGLEKHFIYYLTDLLDNIKRMV
ncbi:MAG: transcription-repair coupling factor [Bacilli bacterium]|nr:transcription-repair coupling factor [Bacilli bacterium]